MADLTTIRIYGDIGDMGWWSADYVTPSQVAEQLPRSGDVLVLINSPGGSAFDGIAIFNLLRRHAREAGRVRVEIDGLAGSAASLIAMAGDEILMGSGAMFMIHDPSSACFGTADDMRKSASSLDEIKAAGIEIYGRSGQSAEKLAEIMSEETWLTAQKAVTLGFATGLADGTRETMRAGAAQFNARWLERYPALPEAARGYFSMKAPSAPEAKKMSTPTPTPAAPAAPAPAPAQPAADPATPPPAPAPAPAPAKPADDTAQQDLAKQFAEMKAELAVQKQAAETLRYDNLIERGKAENRIVGPAHEQAVRQNYKTAADLEVYLRTAQAVPAPSPATPDRSGAAGLTAADHAVLAQLNTQNGQKNLRTMRGESGEIPVTFSPGEYAAARQRAEQKLRAKDPQNWS